MLPLALALLADPQVGKPVTELPPLAEGVSAMDHEHRYLAVALRDGGFAVVAMESVPPTIRTSALPDKLVHVAWSSDAQRLALVTLDGPVRIVTREELQSPIFTCAPVALPHRFAPPRPADLHRRAWFANGDQRILVALGAGPADLWSIPDVARLPLSKGNAGDGETAVAVSRDGRRAALAGESGLVRVLDLQSGNSIDTFTLPTYSLHGKVLSLDFDPSGTRLAIGGGDGRAYVWRFGASEAPRSILVEDPTYGSPAVGCVRFSPDGTLLATSALPYWNVRVWSMLDDSQVAGFQYEDSGERRMPVWFSADGKRATTSLGLRFLTLSKPRVVSIRSADPNWDTWFNSDGDYAWAVVDHHLVVRKIPNEEPILRIPVRGQ